MGIVILENFKTVLTTIRSLFYIWGTVGRRPFKIFTMIKVYIDTGLQKLAIIKEGHRLSLMYNVHGGGADH